MTLCMEQPFLKLIDSYISMKILLIYTLFIEGSPHYYSESDFYQLLS